MKPDPVHQKLREIAWRRRLTPTEQAEWQAWLAAHPEAQGEAELEAALDAALEVRPPVPVSSNFTARVMQAIEADARRETASSAPVRQWWRKLLPRLAIASCVLAMSALAYRQYLVGKQKELVIAAQEIVSAQSLANTTVIQDFDVIRHLPSPAVAEAAPASVTPAATFVAPSVSAPQAAAPTEKRSAKSEESVRVPAERLDELMDRVGELVIAQSRLSQIAAATPNLDLRAVSEDIERLSNELRNTMMVLRMVPVGALFGRFRRLVHDLSRETGKTIDLVTDGEATEVDKTVVERLADPLVHLVRNAVDHGLETPEQRRAAGKTEAGQVRLSARQAGDEVVISISDDGRGIDLKRVREKAESQGLVTPGSILSEAETLQLIFQPGFSTAATVTNLSGRGVGMDVVKRTVEALRGTIDVQSRSGLGSTISLRIPLTLAIIDGLLVRVGSGRYVIPLSAVEECLELSPEEDLRSRGRSFLSVRDMLVPFLRLRDVFVTGTQPDRFQKVVVVSTGSERVGLVVDQIIGDHQTVIKAMSKLHEDIAMFSGATILGDGAVALILDVPHLVATGQEQEAQLRAAG